MNSQRIDIMPTVRNYDFDLPVERMRDWHPAGRHVTGSFNAKSLFFPEGEKFFIQSVRYYRDRIPAGPLQDAVTAFIAQEGAHGREHRDYNRAIAQAGFPADQIERKIIRTLDITRRFTPRAHQLAVTIALEHFTAIMAHRLLEDPEVLAGADPRYAAIWRWHAVEETEHKAVAFDVYQATVGKGLRGYLRRCIVMLGTSVFFVFNVWRHHIALMKHDGLHRDWAGWRHYLHHAFVRPGVYRKIFWDWLDYFRPGFHPWQHDNRELLARWQAVTTDPRADHHLLEHDR